MPTLITPCGGGGGSGFVPKSYRAAGDGAGMTLAPGTHDTITWNNQNSPEGYYTFPDQQTVQTPTAGTTDYTHHVLQVNMRRSGGGAVDPTSIRVQIVPTWGTGANFAMSSGKDTNGLWVIAGSYGIDVSGIVSQTYTAVVYNDDAANTYIIARCSLFGYRVDYF